MNTNLNGFNMPEQAARDLLERMEIAGAQSMTAGELAELADLIVVYRMAMQTVKMILERADSQIDSIDQELLAAARLADHCRQQWENLPDER